MLSCALLSLTTIFGFISCVLAANATAISSDGCVSPSTFATCLQSANTQAATCVDEAGGNDLYVIACEMQQEVNQLLCYMSDCWNKVRPWLITTIALCSISCNQSAYHFNLE